jgi:hypothetical protein
LDIKLFAPLQIAYQKGVRARSRFQGFYQVDKVEFLEVLQDARDKAFTTKNILSGWQAAGLSPFNPEIILQTLPSTDTKSLSRPQTPSVTFTSATGESIRVLVTPANSTHVKALFEEVLQGDLDPAIALKVQKIYKATDKAMANLQIQQATNNVLLEAVNEKKRRNGRKNETLGCARVMDRQFLFKRQQEKDEREYEATWKAFRRLGSYLFNTIPGVMEPHQRAKPKPKPKPKLVASPVEKALGTANLFATPGKAPAVVATAKTPRKRGRPRKNPVAVAVAVAVAPVLVPEPEYLLTRTGRKVKVPIQFGC